MNKNPSMLKDLEQLGIVESSEQDRAFELISKLEKFDLTNSNPMLVRDLISKAAKVIEENKGKNPIKCIHSEICEKRTECDLLLAEEIFENPCIITINPQFLTKLEINYLCNLISKKQFFWDSQILEYSKQLFSKKNSDYIKSAVELINLMCKTNLANTLVINTIPPLKTPYTLFFGFTTYIFLFNIDSAIQTTGFFQDMGKYLIEFFLIIILINIFFRIYIAIKKPNTSVIPLIKPIFITKTGLNMLMVGILITLTNIAMQIF